ncbi:thiamine-phosphate pyrophosphorylase [Chromobacterium alkanivorans]|uniref:thiamine phosphate synthase n=1 Tax=Chromobacterium alkanivorans TaxID=1071719 RepID=UPI002169B859|nr:thiamine phosphate synthase [Chromobacterium alkanivorans]MCS3803279.1 thiamine-phosphate pyrophosphorylase [Chromobacterium alkanivorans]MCS3817611.1 thiamine-phosphate pyrophosphorylase [Chromobacterium alkanivorans]MCS3872645.1 thiamine-phosphate pyrophosphorylase [Chromobacterium alkanivorans]
MPARLKGLYAITPDTEDSARLLSLTQAAAPHIDILQYRNKSPDAALRLEQAQALAELCRRSGVVFIVNDDVELAARVGADGVHLGRDDGALSAARRRLGAGALIGASCYDSLERARRAVEAGASYVAFGAVFPSGTKPDAARAELGLFAAARTLDAPLVAIGGIDAGNAERALAAGADAIAVIGGVFGAADPAAAARELAEICRRNGR